MVLFRTKVLCSKSICVDVHLCLQMFAAALALSNFTSDFQEEPDRGGEVAHSVTFLPCKQDDLSAIPRTHTRKPGLLVCACTPNAEEAGEVRTRGPLRAA